MATGRIAEAARHGIGPFAGDLRDFRMEAAEVVEGGKLASAVAAVEDTSPG